MYPHGKEVPTVSAADSYWEAVEMGRLPIALVIETEDGVRGIATVVFGREVTKASDVSNPDCSMTDRFKSVLRATEIARKKIAEEYNGIIFGPDVRQP